MEYELDENGMGPLEYVFLERLLKGGEVDYTDFIGTSITKENIDEVARRFNAAFLKKSVNDDGLRVRYMDLQ